jgi:hypothetical protein
MQFLLTPDPNVTCSTCLMRKAEHGSRAGAARYPVERTLLVSGILESCLTSKIQQHQRIELRVAFQTPRESQFARS